MPTRRQVLAFAAATAATPAGAQGAWYPLEDASGRELTNFRIPVELETELGELDNVFAAGPEDADLTLTEVYDSNCGWCRRAAADIKAIAANDPDLRIRYLNAPSLGIASVQAAKVEYAVKRLGGDEQALAFHHAFMAERGVLDGARALLIASDLGLDLREVEAAADAEQTGAVLREAIRLANATSLSATPSFLIGGVALVGYPGRRTLEAVIRDMRECDRPVCG